MIRIEVQPEYKKFTKGDYFFNKILRTLLIILDHFLLDACSKVPRKCKNLKSSTLDPIVGYKQLYFNVLCISIDNFTVFILLTLLVNLISVIEFLKDH